MRYLAICTLAFALASPVALAEVFSSDPKWSVSRDFEKNADEKKSAAKNLSGAVCTPGTNVCLVVNDEKKYAQFFQIEGNTLVSSEDLLIRLLPDYIGTSKMDEIDAEGVAYEARPPTERDFIYIIGSHGKSKNGDLQVSRFFLLRFPVERTTGLPPFPIGDEDTPDPAVEKTPLLRGTISMLEPLDEFAERPLDQNGVNVEGLAIREGILNVAFRSPCLPDGDDFYGFILRAPLAELFKTEPPASAHVVRLKLEDNTGIRDLASVESGFLILGGRSDDEEVGGKSSCGANRPPPAVASSIWFWNGLEGSNPVRLGDLPGTTNEEKPDSLTVLAETEEYYRVLVLLDGVKNGSPREFLIPK